MNKFLFKGKGNGIILYWSIIVLEKNVQNVFPRIPQKKFKFFKMWFYSMKIRVLDLKLYF